MRYVLSLLILLATLGVKAQGDRLPPFTFQEHSTVFADANRLFSNEVGYTETDTLSDAIILASLVRIMEMNPGLMISLEGHTALNEDSLLGMRRAESIRELLMIRGVDGDRMTLLNHAHRFPVLADSSILKLDTPIEKAMANQSNRRVEVRVIGNQEE